MSLKPLALGAVLLFSGTAPRSFAGLASRPSLRDQLVSHFGASGPRSSELLQVLERFQELDAGSQKALLAQADVRRSLTDRIVRLVERADDENAALGEAQEAHHELQILLRELRNGASEAQAMLLESSEREAAKAVHKRVASAVETEGEALREAWRALEEPRRRGETRAATAEPLLPAPSAGRDRTLEYLALWNAGDAPLKPEHVEQLKNFDVVFVKGVGVDLFIKFFQYFDEQMKWLDGLGVANRRAATNAEAPAKKNEPALADAIRSSQKGVILISHSKGGVDVLETLLDRPELRAKVKGWIPIQVPFAGSPVADWLGRHPALRLPIALAFRLFSGGLEALTELETARRREFLAGNDRAIRELAREVPILSAATWKGREPGRYDSLLKLQRDWMERLGMKNDGFVPLDSAVLPHADHARIEGIDHQAPAMPSLFLRFDRVRFTGVLLRMLLDRISKGATYEAAPLRRGSASRPAFRPSRFARGRDLVVKMPDPGVGLQAL